LKEFDIPQGSRKRKGPRRGNKGGKKRMNQKRKQRKGTMPIAPLKKLAGEKRKESDPTEFQNRGKNQGKKDKRKKETKSVWGIPRRGRKHAWRGKKKTSEQGRKPHRRK